MDGVGGRPNKELFMSLGELKVEIVELALIIGIEAEGNYHQVKAQLCKSPHVKQLKANKLLHSGKILAALPIFW